MGEDVKKYIQEGIHFSNEFMDVIEDVSRKVSGTYFRINGNWSFR